jgi:hypothetical protein
MSTKTVTQNLAFSCLNVLKTVYLKKKILHNVRVGFGSGSITFGKSEPRIIKRGGSTTMCPTFLRFAPNYLPPRTETDPACSEG